VHEGIATRVLGTAVRVAAAGKPCPPYRAEKTFGQFEDAMEGLPESLTSVHMGTLYLGGAFYIYSARSTGGSNVGWVRGRSLRLVPLPASTPRHGHQTDGLAQRPGRLRPSASATSSACALDPGTAVVQRHGRARACASRWHFTVCLNTTSASSSLCYLRVLVSFSTYFLRGAGLLLAVSTLAACTEEGPHFDPAVVAEANLPIINGDPDNDRDAVVLVFSNQSACTGTIIDVVGTDAFVLTAAHCFGQGQVQGIVIGDNYNSPDAVLQMTDFETHPQYDPNNQYVYDFAMMRVTGANASTPIIPVLTPPEDDLQPGRTLIHVGYGRTQDGGQPSPQRLQGSSVLDQVGQIQIGWDQSTGKGICQGDSGGPNLVDTPNGERVAGVNSFVVGSCLSYAVSGRPSSIYDSFIVPFVGPGGSVASSTSATTVGATGVGGAAGVGGGGMVGGTGAAGPVDGSWTNGSDAEDYGGSQRANSGCSAGGRSSDMAGALGLLLGLAALRRRRLT